MLVIKSRKFITLSDHRCLQRSGRDAQRRAICLQVQQLRLACVILIVVPQFLTAVRQTKLILKHMLNVCATVIDQRNNNILLTEMSGDRF